MKTQMTSSSISFKKVLPAERYLRASANEPAINDAELTRIRAAIARAEKAEAELKQVDETGKAMIQISEERIAELEQDRARLDWLLARDVSLTIWHQGPNSGGASIATYSNRDAIDAAMKEARK